MSLPRLPVPHQTKRPENIAKMMPHGKWLNAWLGTSIESIDVLPRIDQLLEAWEKIEVPVRFISGEPLLGPLDLRGMLHKQCGINWVIGGGESGGHARECGIDWCRSIVDQCKKAQVAVFVKQLGKNPTMPEVEGEETRRVSLPLYMHEKGGYMNEWPADLRVSEFPQ